jgi:hypothetical protein
LFIFYTHSASVICSVHILYISRLNYNSQEIKCIFKLSETCQNQTLNKLESCINRTKYSPNEVLISQTLVYSEQNNWSQDALVVQAYPKTFGHLSRNSSKRLDCNISPSQQKPLKHKENLSVLWCLADYLFGIFFIMKISNLWLILVLSAFEFGLLFWYMFNVINKSTDTYLM